MAGSVGDQCACDVSAYFCLILKEYPTNPHSQLNRRGAQVRRASSLQHESCQPGRSERRRWQAQAGLKGGTILAKAQIGPCLSGYPPAQEVIHV